MKKKFIPAISISLNMLFFNTIPVIAKTDVEPNPNSYHLDKKQDKKQHIAQASDSRENKVEEIIKHSKQSISNLERLNPNANPLSFPTQPKEVEVGTIQPITRKQAIQLSLKNNKDIIEARIRIERSQFALRQQKAALFPTLDFRSGTSPSILSYENNGFLDTASEQAAQAGIAPNSPQGSILQSMSAEKFDFNPSLDLRYDIYDGGFRGASISSAEKQLRITELDLETTVEQTRLQVSTDYYALQNGDAQVEIQSAAVRDATRTLRDAQLLTEAGVGTRFDVLRARVELDRSKQNLVTALANQEIARRQLTETLGISQNANLAAADAIEEAGIWKLSLPESIVQAFKNRAELEQFLLQREIGEQQRTIALSQIRPIVSTTASYMLTDNFEDDFDITDQYVLGLNIQWRLFDGGAARAQAQQADKDIEIAETQFANVRNQIRFAVERAYLQLTSNQTNTITAADEVDLAEESLSMARLRFKEGIGTQTDVIDAQSRLTSARANLLSSITSYNQSYASLQRQISNTPDNSLQDLP